MDKIVMDSQFEHVQRFASTVLIYGQVIGSQIFTREAAVDLLAQINEHPERSAVSIHNTLYAVKRAWLEADDENTGRLMIEYERTEAQ